MCPRKKIRMKIKKGHFFPFQIWYLVQKTGKLAPGGGLGGGGGGEGPELILQFNRLVCNTGPETSTAQQTIIMIIIIIAL